MLPKLALRNPAWQTETIARESSVLLQLTADGPIESRLAFPAAEILAIEAADGSHQFQLGKDCQLSDDKLRLIWNAATKIEVITAAQMFPPKDAPNSYRHRASNPEQNMFYAPGRFFHQHDIEVTYRRQNFQAKQSEVKQRGTNPHARKIAVRQTLTGRREWRQHLDGFGCFRNNSNSPQPARLSRIGGCTTYERLWCGD